jgi:hypothetical protein
VYLKTRICSFLLVTAALAILPTALDQGHREHLRKIQADGGAPPAPPFPWLRGPVDAPILDADGGAPPPPPFPWRMARLQERS